jgi:hypothetical protein
MTKKNESSTRAKFYFFFKKKRAFFQGEYANSRKTEKLLLIFRFSILKYFAIYKKLFFRDTESIAKFQIRTIKQYFQHSSTPPHTRK